MGEAVAHRGPDGEGVWSEGAVAFAHRRLAILDLTDAGHQPMQSADGRYVLNYNGEVFNYAQLRVELSAKGHRFHSQSDTEVVLEALAEWGLDAIPRFNGMFAFALWDRRDQVLHLVRDRYGIKPLYYAELGGTLLFGSEIKALLAYPGMRAEMDREALAEYLTFQNFITDRTLFAGVSLVPAGTVRSTALSRCANATPTLHRYWDFSFSEPDDPAPTGDYVEELDRLFQQAVGRQLVSDVPVGSYLSGGMDSGSITAVAAGQISDLRTFTVGFDLHSASGIELGFDERRRAEYMSYAFGTEHYEMVLKAGDMERSMPRLVEHLEEPRVGQSYPNYYAAQLASKFGKVVLSGAGGDELFAGYPWRYYRAVVNDDFEHYVDKYAGFWQRLVTEAELQALLGTPQGSAAPPPARDMLRSVFTSHADRLTRPEDYINHSLYFEARTFLHGLLVVEDKLSMAHSLETRLPFLDNDLVDFAQRVPVGLKLGNLGEVVRLNENEPGPKTQRFFERTQDGKLLLRQAMERHLPAHVSSAEKQGFSGPDASWFRGESIDYVRRRLLCQDARVFAYLDRETVHALVGEHLAGQRNRRLLIWSLLFLEQWCETFLEGSATEPGRA